MSESDKDINESVESTEDHVAEASSPKVSQTSRSSRNPRGSKSGGSVWGAALVALVLGGAGGWLGHQFQTDKALKAADAAVAGEGDAARGPCKDWETKICDEFGAEAFACNQAKNSSPLLPGSACQQALKTVSATFTKIHAARTSCDTVSAKLCAELGAETRTCKMVQKDTPTFPPEKCEEIVTNYDQVVAQLKSMEQRSGMGGPPGMAPGGHPGMGAPPGMAPGAHPAAPAAPGAHP